MTDMAMPARGKAAAGPKYLYFQMALVCLAVAFLGFLPTYWMPMAQGTAQFDPVVHIHGMIFFAWTLFFVFQTWIGATGQVARHRAVGLIGVSLATAMVIFGVILSIHVMRGAAAHGKAEAGIRLAVVPLTNIALFAVLMIAAFINTRRPEWHKRFMLLAAISILGAAIVRWFFALGHVSRPPPVIVPLQAEALVVLLLAFHRKAPSRLAVGFWRRRGCAPAAGDDRPDPSLARHRSFCVRPGGLTVLATAPPPP